MSKYLYLVLLIVILRSFTSIQAQIKKRITLNDALELAQTQSLQALLDQHNYLTEYWAYKSYLASQRPSVNLSTTPLSYTSAANLRYNSNTQTEEYILTENINSNLNLTVEQNLAFTGGKIFVNSSLNRIGNFGLNIYDQYASVPIQVGYSQSISGYNNQKWIKKIAPIQYNRAQKQFIESREIINQQVSSLFFALAKAEASLQIAQNNLANTDNLLQIARKRLLLGSVTKAEVLDLELNLNNNRIDLQTNEILNREASENLINYLNLSSSEPIQIHLPDSYPLTHVDQQLVLEMAIANNPSLLQQQEFVLKSQQEVAKAKSQRYLQADVYASYGISKTDGDQTKTGSVAEVFRSEFEKYKRLEIGITIPLLDWGKARGEYQMALSRQQIAELTSQQARQQFEQSLRTFATTFNLQQAKADAAIRSDSLARQSYELTLANFRLGKADVLRVTNSQRSKDEARQNYIVTLAAYWQAYYELRKLTLFDFNTLQPLALPALDN